MGCEQKHLFEIQKSPLSMTDVLTIQRDLGFFLQKPESQKSEFNLRWILQREGLHSTLLHSESDFLGDPQLASHFWLKENLSASGETPNGYSTRWDELVRDKLNSQEKDPAFAKKIRKEFYLDAYEDIQLKQLPKLSASQLQKFDECGFKFFVERVLKLSPQESYDLEIDPMYNGQLLHRVLEVLLEKYPSLDVDKKTLDALYDNVVQEMAAKFPLQKFWLNEKNRQLAFIQNFISLELEYRKTHPQVQIAGIEVSLRGYITSEDQQILLTPEAQNETSFLFSGKIDRVDRDALGRYAIIDYKTSKGAGLKAFSSWLSNSQFQMTLYAQAVENGLAESVPPAPVKAAEYIFLKDKKRGSGYILETEDNGFVGLETKVKTVSAEKKLEHDEQFSTLISQHLAAIQKGVFRPQPKDVKICETCHWSSTCRAPHLR
jgi:ATP-dependent helicase/DNAse subunit B